MGIGIVLLLWAVVGTILACLGTLFMGGVTALLTRRVQRGRFRVIVAAAIFPFVCLGWAAGLFVFQAFVNAAMHRDPGLGDTWQCPFPNHYALTMIDDTDQGWIYNPKTQPTQDGVSEQADAVDGVIIAQVADRYILGGVTTNRFGNPEELKQNINSYFLLDTQTGKRTNFPTRELLRTAATGIGIQLNLEPISAVYSHYRYTWFDTAMVVLLFALPLPYFIFLVHGVLKVRKPASVAVAA